MLSLERSLAVTIKARFNGWAAKFNKLLDVANGQIGTAIDLVETEIRWHKAAPGERLRHARLAYRAALQHRVTAEKLWLESKIDVSEMLQCRYMVKLLEHQLFILGGE